MKGLISTSMGLNVEWPDEQTPEMKDRCSRLMRALKATEALNLDVDSDRFEQLVQRFEALARVVEVIQAEKRGDVVEFPKDALLIVAANTGAQLVEHMHVCVETHCYRCETPLQVDSHAIAQSVTFPGRKERPIRFCCLRCARQHQHPALVGLVMPVQEKEGLSHAQRN